MNWLLRRFRPEQVRELILVLLIITFIPDLVLFIPSLFDTVG